MKSEGKQNETLSRRFKRGKKMIPKSFIFFFMYIIRTLVSRNSLLYEDRSRRIKINQALEYERSWYNAFSKKKKIYIYVGT